MYDMMRGKYHTISKEDMIMLKIMQKGFNYSQDGPGNRLVYHLQGCNMRCPWCANPEGLSVKGTLMHVKDANSGRIKEKMSCSECSVENLVEEVQRSRMMFFENGGVTFTGGEPTLQFEPLKRLMKQLKELGIHIAMENNGTNPRLEELLPYIDYLIMDFKHPDENIHKQVTGVSNEITKKNLIRILETGRQIAVRIPLIHGFNDTDDALQGFVEFFSEYAVSKNSTSDAVNKTGEMITLEILPYHEYGKEKWLQCGLEYAVEDGFVSEERVQLFEETFRKTGINVIHT